MKRCLTALLLLVLAATASAARGEGEEKKVTLRGHELALPEPVKFEAGSDKIEAAADASLAVHVTVVVPRGKNDPAAGEQTTVTPGQLSEAVGGG